MSNFVRSSILISTAGDNQEQAIYQKDDKQLQFKSLQEQVKDQIDEQKKVQLQAEFQRKKEELALTEAANAAKHEFVEIDEDFDYFQYWQENKAETEALWKQQDQEDIKKYKEGRAKIIYNQGGKEPEIKLEKQQYTPLFQPKSQMKVIIKPKNKQISNGKEVEESKKETDKQEIKEPEKKKVCLNESKNKNILLFDYDD